MVCLVLLRCAWLLLSHSLEHGLSGDPYGDRSRSSRMVWSSCQEQKRKKKQSMVGRSCGGTYATWASWLLIPRSSWCTVRNAGCSRASVYSAVRMLTRWPYSYAIRDSVQVNVGCCKILRSVDQRGRGRNLCCYRGPKLQESRVSWIGGRPVPEWEYWDLDVWEALQVISRQLLYDGMRDRALGALPPLPCPIRLLADWL